LHRNQYFGPGQVASKYLDNISTDIIIPGIDEKTGEPKDHKLKSLSAEYHRRTVDPEFWNAAKHTYYGGRFEIFYHGKYPGTCFEYDINSAYPYVMMQLPCLHCGRYIRRKGLIGERPPIHFPGYGLGEKQHLCIVHAKVYPPSRVRFSSRVGPLPHRNENGSILFPRSVHGWYWLHELQAAERAGLVGKWECLDWHVYKPRKCKHGRPLRAIAELYQDRIALGEYGKNSPNGVAKKLTYNSIYGKMAQSVGNPKYSNPVYASLITAGCRIMMLDAIGSHPLRDKAVLMIATDGIYFTHEHPGLNRDKTKLGAWSRKKRENLTLVQPGAYFDDATVRGLEKAKETGDYSAIAVKSRGINFKNFAQKIPDLIKAFENFKPGDPWPSIDIPIAFQVTSGRLAAARGKWYTCGEVIIDKHKSEFARQRNHKTVSADPSLKRRAHGPGWSEPYPEIPDGRGDLLMSTSYDGSFGDDRAVREVLHGYGEHPDGPLDDQLAALTTGKSAEVFIPDYDDTFVDFESEE
jgi:hypothetical protein